MEDNGTESTGAKGGQVSNGGCSSFVAGKSTRLQEQLFADLGRKVHRRPVLALCLNLLLFISCMPGVLLLTGSSNLYFLRLQTDFLLTYTLTDAVEYIEYQDATNIFPDPHSISIIMVPLRAAAVSYDALHAAVQLQSHVMVSVKAWQGGKERSYADVCERSSPHAPCMAISAASTLLGHGQAGHQKLLEVQSREAAGQTSSQIATWLISGLSIMQRELLPLLASSSSSFPGVGASDVALGGWLAGATTLFARLDLASSEAGHAFEVEASNYFVEHELHIPKAGDVMRFSTMSTATVGEETAKIGTAAMPMVVVTIAIMCCYVVAMLGTATRQAGETQIGVVLLATCIPFLASLSSFGLLGYLGFELNVLAVMVPFLGLAVGIDALFIVITQVKAVDSNMDGAGIMAEAMAKAGVAITTTTLTSVCAFSISAATTTNFPGMHVFNVGLVFVLIFNWTGMLVFLPALVVLNERRVAANRYDLLPCKKRRGRKPDSAETEETRRVRRRCNMCGLGICGHNWMGSHGHLIENSLAWQVIGAMLWIGLVALGAATLPNIGAAMPDTYLFTDGSIALTFSQDLTAAYGDVVPAELKLLFMRPRLSESRYRHGLLMLYGELRNITGRIGPEDCWLAFVAAELPAQADAAIANTAVTSFLDPNTTTGAQFARDAAFEGGELTAARCRLAFWQESNAKKRADQADDLRALAARSGLQATAYDITFPVHVSRSKRIMEITLLTAAYCVCGVSVALLLTMPLHMAFLAVLNVAAVLVVLFGFMSIVNITANIISYTTCVMAVGFCVDYSCHVLHFAHHDIPAGTPWNARMNISLQACGFDVFNGCLTAFMGVCLLSVNGAMAFKIFALLAAVITSTGGLFALWGLPACLALLSRSFCKEARMEVMTI